jgi:hypothetical protein
MRMFLRFVATSLFFFWVIKKCVSLIFFLRKKPLTQEQSSPQKYHEGNVVEADYKVVKEY